MDIYNIGAWRLDVLVLRLPAPPYTPESPLLLNDDRFIVVDENYLKKGENFGKKQPTHSSLCLCVFL